GCNSLSATRLGLKLGDILVTEAGFGADLGAEKFFDIKCRSGALRPDAAVLVATVRALKYNGGVPRSQLSQENLPALQRGIVNLDKHIENIRQFGVPCLVALNAFPDDTEAEIQVIRDTCARHGVGMSVSEVFSRGGAGGLDLAEKLLRLFESEPADFQPLYPLDCPLEEKMRRIACRLYGADDIALTAPARRQLEWLEQHGFSNLPVCMAKTQYSLSDDPTKLGRPEGFTLTVRELTVSAGAGFVVALTGNILTMPGLPAKPAAETIDIDDNGTISGLF
ncbi:MAG: formate--tetrahydrofolate ligase, partial [Eubacteriales bacterium]|nr:formate--tetrahydrofolate ligase [Eubacteriales bacterium]